LEQRTVTFLFTDIEDSTALWERDANAMALALRSHDEILRSAIELSGGHVFKTVGDAFCSYFPDASGAMGAAIEAQRRLEREAWPPGAVVRVRMGIHTGDASPVGDDWFGPTVNRVARILALGHGGQVLSSEAARSSLSEATNASVQFLDLGEHRLRNIARPERIYQLCAEGLDHRFPPLKSEASQHHNLPEELTSFVGRESVTREAASLIASNRLVTLVGSGGIGKTRSAIQIGSRSVDRFPEGVWFVDLSRTSEGSEVTAAAMGALGLRDKTGLSPIDQLSSYLGSRNCLLIVDNCEHVIASAAEMVEQILKRCGKVSVLATSREPLRTPGETVFRVPSLELPAGDSWEAFIGSEAVKLFAQRARSNNQAFELGPGDMEAVSEICKQLDGIPLAIELAAARLRSLSLEDIRTRLRDRFRLLVAGDRTATPRQKTLRAAIEWSTDLLSAEERLVFDRLSVFRGGWSMPAAESVCSDESLSEWDVLDLVSSLVDKSLVVLEDTGRFKFLESLRQIAEENLSRRDGEPARTQAKHLEYYAAMLREAGPQLEGSSQPEWFARFDLERDNLLAAHDYAFTPLGSVQLARLLAAELSRYWMTRGSFATVFPRVVRLVEADPQEPSEPLAAAQRAAGVIAFGGNALPVSIRYLGLARDTYGLLGNVRAQSGLTSNLATALYANCELERAGELAAESLQAQAGKEPRGGEASCLGLLGMIALDSGRFEEGFEFESRSVELWRQVGNKHAIAVAVNNLGHAALGLGRLDEAEAHYRESIGLRLELGDRQGLIWSLEGFARLAVERLDVERGAFLTGAAVRLRVDNQISAVPSDRLQLDRSEARMVATLGRERFEALWMEGHMAGTDAAVRVALSGDPLSEACSG
jgi:predicted ATPase/class 3 adenylate cyclase